VRKELLHGEGGSREGKRGALTLECFGSSEIKANVQLRISYVSGCKKEAIITSMANWVVLK
jgi:hypothetical protein